MSPEKKHDLSTLYRIRPRFLRSVNLQRDFADPLACRGYVLTDMLRDATSAITDGLRPSSGRRAWRITGDYGTGKSSFGVFLAHMLSGSRAQLPKNLQRSVKWKALGISPPNMLPVLVAGSREPIGPAIAKGLADAILSVYKKPPTAQAYRPLLSLAYGKKKYNDKNLISSVLLARDELVRQKKATGVFFVLDELGKFLEYETLRPEGQDIYILQMLAEEAARSAEKPLFLLALMHQSFTTYAENLTQASRKEWEKISGRFDELVFQYPLAQSATLLSAALNLDVQQIPSAKRTEARKCMDASIDMGLFGPSTSRKALSSLAESLFPLSPTALPILVRILHRFGQNERSLFSFALSEEPFGLQRFSTTAPQSIEFYRACDLYDYVRSNLAGVIQEQSANNHWNIIDSTIENALNKDPIRVAVLKTVGLLNLLNASDMLATENALLWCIAGSKQKMRRSVKQAIVALRKGKVLHFRGLGGGYCLWPHTSIDLAHLRKETLSSLGPIERPTEVIKDYLDTRSIVARKHYILTGNLRHFDIEYASFDDIQSGTTSFSQDADGRIVVVLSDSTEERSSAITCLRGRKVKAPNTTIFALPQPITNITSELEEARCWDWVAQNCMQLNSDGYAREEVERKRTLSRARLNGRIGDLLNLRLHSGSMNIEWFWKHKPRTITSGRDLVAFLSRVCDKEYALAPRLRNELVNRRNPSSAAAAARLRLISLLLSSPHLDRLGIPKDKKPPEMSMYLSLLKQGGIHKKKRGRWQLLVPKRADQDLCNIRPSFAKIDALLDDAGDTKVSVRTIFEELRAAPYGLRNGLIPVILALFVAIYRDKIALYEDGSFLPEIDEREFQRMIKEPQAFEIQRCSIEGVRAEVYEHLMDALQLSRDERTKQDILAVVQPLCVFVAGLPDYARSTKRISSPAQQVRSSILGATDPVSLLFTDLPQACGCTAIDQASTISKREVSGFAKKLRSCIDDLRSSYERLTHRICRRLQQEFGVNSSLSETRKSLASRSAVLTPSVTQQQLRAFCLALADTNLPSDKWVESLASLVVTKPPNRWADKDEMVFDQELHHLVGLFIRLETMLFDAGEPSAPTDKAVRLTITKPNGEEVSQVLRYSDSDKKDVHAAKKALSKLLADAGTSGLVALSEIIWADSGSSKRGGGDE